MKLLRFRLRRADARERCDREHARQIPTAVVRRPAFTAGWPAPESPSSDTELAPGNDVRVDFAPGWPLV